MNCIYISLLSVDRTLQYYSLISLYHCFLGCRFIGKKNYLATDEGNDLGGKTGHSLEDCEKFCRQTNGCNSFTYCHKHKICNLNDKLNIGTRKGNNVCTTFYNSCGSGKEF